MKQIAPHLGCYFKIWQGGDMNYFALNNIILALNMTPEVAAKREELKKIWCATSLFDNIYESVSNLNIGNTILNCFGVGSEASGTITQAYEEMIGIATKISNGVAGIGCAIAILFFMISLIEFAMSDRLTIESFVKFFAKVAIPLFLIPLSATLCSKLIDFGTGISQTIIDTLNATTVDAKSLESFGLNLAQAILDEKSFKGITGALFAMLSYGIEGLILKLVSLILVGIVYIIAFSRILEMGVRMAFMPIALGLIADDGWRGSAGRYIKKFLALASQSAVMVVIGVVYNRISTTPMTAIINKGSCIPGLSDFVIMIGLAIAVVSIMFKSIGFINDVFGA